MGMASTIVDTWEKSLLLWLLMGMAQSTIVDTHGNGLYYCGYSWEWPSVLLWMHMGIASTFVSTHGNVLYFCGYAWEWPLLL